MERKEMYFNTHAIKINKDNYRSGLNLALFFRSLMTVLVRGESPIEHRPGYARKQVRL